MGSALMRFEKDKELQATGIFQLRSSWRNEVNNALDLRSNESHIRDRAISAIRIMNHPTAMGMSNEGYRDSISPYK